jgi:hypothetical protein
VPGGCGGLELGPHAKARPWALPRLGEEGLALQGEPFHHVIVAVGEDRWSALSAAPLCHHRIPCQVRPSSQFTYCFERAADLSADAGARRDTLRAHLWAASQQARRRFVLSKSMWIRRTPLAARLLYPLRAMRLPGRRLESAVSFPLEQRCGPPPCNGALSLILLPSVRNQR